VVKYAESFGANGYRISSAGELLPTPRTALGEEGVSIIACPSTTQRTSVLTDALGQLDTTP
jgi:acetolactate synthase I/II/III large subunit